MGADLVLAITAYPTLANGDAVKAGDELSARVRAALSDISDEALQDVADGTGDEDDLEAFREMLENAIDEFFGSPIPPRDVNLVCLGGQWWLITGGMSWGDDPTESFAAITALEYLGVSGQLDTDS